MNKHPAEIEWNAEGGVTEGCVLLRIEHFQQGGRRVALEVAVAQLVDLVQHDDTVAFAHASECLDDVARHRTDIGAAMATDLRLVMRAAQADPDELAAHDMSDRLTQGSLADARRPDKAENGPFARGIQLANRKKLQGPALDLV